MKLSIVAAAALIGVMSIGVAVPNLLTLDYVCSHRFAIPELIAKVGFPLLRAVHGRRFAIEAILLALVAGLHLVLIIESRPRGQKLRRLELTIISLYLSVILVNILAICVDGMDGSKVA